MTKIQKIFSLGLSSFAAFALAATAVLAVGVKPVRTELAIDPGASATATIQVINSESFPVTVIPEITVYTKNDENGFPVAEDLAADDPMNIQDWISLDTTPLDLEPNSTQEVSFTVTVPEDAEPGGRYASVLYTATDEEEAAGIKIQTAVPSLILVKVSGEELHTSEVTNFTVKSDKMLGDKSPVFAVEFKNEGNVHEKPRASITLTDADGVQLTEVATYKDPDSGEVIVADAIPLNLIGGNVLPGSSRIFTGGWNQNVQSGKFTATLELNYGGQPTITRTTEIEIQESLTVNSFEINQMENSTDFSLTLTNSGNVYERPEGTIKITNEFDEVAAEPEIPADVEYIAPGSTATITIPWLSKQVPSGEYVANLAATYGFADAPLTAEVHFSSSAVDYIMIAMIGGGVVLVALLAIVIILLVRRKKVPGMEE